MNKLPDEASTGTVPVEWRTDTKITNALFGVVDEEFSREARGRKLSRHAHLAPDRLAEACVDQPFKDGAALDFDMEATELYLCSPAFDSLAQIRADRRRIQREFAQCAETEQARNDAAGDDEPRVAAHAPAGTAAEAHNGEEDGDDDDLQVANLEESLLGKAYQALFNTTTDITPEEAFDLCLKLPRERARLFGHRSGHYQADGTCFGCHQRLDRVEPLPVMKQSSGGAGSRASFDRAYQRRRQIAHENECVESAMRDAHEKDFCAKYPHSPGEYPLIPSGNETAATAPYDLLQLDQRVLKRVSLNKTLSCALCDGAFSTLYRRLYYEHLFTHDVWVPAVTAGETAYKASMEPAMELYRAGEWTSESSFQPQPRYFDITGEYLWDPAEVTQACRRLFEARILLGGDVRLVVDGSIGRDGDFLLADLPDMDADESSVGTRGTSSSPLVTARSSRRPSAHSACGTRLGPGPTGWRRGRIWPATRPTPAPI